MTIIIIAPGFSFCLLVKQTVAVTQFLGIDSNSCRSTCTFVWVLAWNKFELMKFSNDTVYKNQPICLVHVHNVIRKHKFSQKSYDKKSVERYC